MDDPEDHVEVYDVLSAMASSLVETDSFFNVTSKPDRPIDTMQTVAGKPPREVFYNKTLTFMTSLPKPVTVKRCTCKYICLGAVATIKCYNCATYDPYGVGYFCDACFKSRHPWHRVAHIFADIEKDENIEYTLKVSHRRAEALRYEKEGNQILEKVKTEKKRLQAGVKTGAAEERIKLVGRKSTDLVAKMREMRQNLRSSIENIEQVYPTPTQDRVLQAAAVLKRALMGFRIRKLVSAMYSERLVRVFDKRTSRDFYYNTVTGATSWTPPRFLLKCHIDMLSYLEEEAPKTLVWSVKNGKKRTRSSAILAPRVAAPILQGFCRCIVARKQAVALAKEVFRRVFDDEFKTYYYVNLVTKQSSWSKPKILLMAEPPIYVLPAKQNAKRDPRINRLS